MIRVHPVWALIHINETNALCWIPADQVSQQTKLGQLLRSARFFCASPLDWQGCIGNLQVKDNMPIESTLKSASAHATKHIRSSYNHRAHLLLWQPDRCNTYNNGTYARAASSNSCKRLHQLQLNARALLCAWCHELKLQPIHIHMLQHAEPSCLSQTLQDISSTKSNATTARIATKRRYK